MYPSTVSVHVEEVYEQYDGVSVDAVGMDARIFRVALAGLPAGGVAPKSRAPALR